MARNASKAPTTTTRRTVPVRFTDAAERKTTTRRGADNEDDLQDLMSALKSTTKNNKTQPSVFGKEKEQIFNEARRKASEATKSGLAQMDAMKQQLDQLEKQEVNFVQEMAEVKSLWEAHAASIQLLLDNYSSTSQDLFARRQEETNEGANTLRRHMEEREASLKTFLKHANTHLERGRENQKVANDARALIKNYKALLHV